MIAISNSLAQWFSAGSYYQVGYENAMYGYFPKLSGNPVSGSLGSFSGDPVVQCKLTDDGIYIHTRCGSTEHFYKFTSYLQIISEEAYFKTSGFVGSAYIRPTGSEIAIGYSEQSRQYVCLKSSVSNDVTTIDIVFLTESSSFNVLLYTDWYCPVLANKSYEALSIGSGADIIANQALDVANAAKASVERLDGIMTNVFVRR